jgi:hypothetical protein
MRRMWPRRSDRLLEAEILSVRSPSLAPSKPRRSRRALSQGTRVVVQGCEKDRNCEIEAEAPIHITAGL